jgi:hypothetical protein
MSVSGETYSAANPKLPLWNAVCLSYSTWLHNFPDVLRTSWLWLAVAGFISWFSPTCISSSAIRLKCLIE